MRVFRTTSLIVPGSTAVDPTPTDGRVHWFYDVVALESVDVIYVPHFFHIHYLPGDIDMTTFLFNSSYMLRKWQTCET